jgi:hypothetical protein
MNFRTLAILLLAALTFSACGPDRGLRFQQTGVTASQVEPGSTSGAMHVKAAITVLSPPESLTLEGHTMWAGVQFADRNQAIQAVHPDTAQERGIVDLPFSVKFVVALASTPNVVWMLTIEQPGARWRLQRLGTSVEPARSAARAVLPASSDSVATLEPVLSLPRNAELLGATNSAVWLLSHHGHGYTLWRCDARTLRIARFPLTSDGKPEVAITPQRVFVVLPAPREHAVSIETRNASGQVITKSPSIQIAGQLLSGRVSACGTQIVGLSYRRGVTRAVRVDAAGSSLRYSNRLSTLTDGSRRADGRFIASFGTASTFGDHCRSIWVAMEEQTYPEPISGFVVRLDTSTLKVTGRIGNLVASKLLWTDGSLWASDMEHAAVLRIG